MRTARLVMPGAGYYHCISRIIERRMVLGPLEKETFRKMMRAVERFSGVEILTYAIMSNHFHILLHVPARQAVDDATFLSRLAEIYPAPVMEQIAMQLRGYREREDGAEAAERLKERYTYRMYDLSEFMKTLKQKFTQWYNKRDTRRGTLWEDRFKSIVLEPGRLSRTDGRRNNALLTIAAYIDLNAVRAGLCEDPKDYRFCGYGEAMGGGEEARAGLGTLLAGYYHRGGWRAVVAAYREQMFVRDQAARRPVFSREQARLVLESGGRLGLGELLRCRVRYFSDGVVLGSKAFVEQVFQANREQFGVKRRSGARPLRHGEWGELCSMRDLRLTAVAVAG